MTPVLRRFLSKNNIIPFLFLVIVLLSSYFVFPQDQLRIFLSFMTLIPVFLIFKIDIGPVEYSIVLLVFSAVELAFINESVANKFVLYAYWLLVVGVALYFIKYLMRTDRLIAS
jgi:hypothetical protein